MKRSLITLFSVGVLLAFLWCQRLFLVGPLLHFRTLAAGMLPLLAFLGPVDFLLRRLMVPGSLCLLDRILFTAFFAYFLASYTAFLLLTAGIAFPLTLLFLLAILLIANLRWFINVAKTVDFSLLKNFVQPGVLPTFSLMSVSLLILFCAGLFPPLGYDAHEYHLVAPEQYLKYGKWVAFPHNVYNAFHMNVELLFMYPLAAQSAAGCTVINFQMALLCALAVARLANIAGYAKSSLLPALLFLSTGMVMHLTLDAYIDLGLTLCAAVFLIAYEKYRETGASGFALVMCCAIGYALGTKFIAGISLVLPALIVILADCVLNKKARLLAPLAGVFAGAIVLWSPWLIRNMVLYQNPFYPLLTETFGGNPQIFADVFKAAHASTITKASMGLAPAPPAGLMADQFVEFFLLPLRKLFADSLPSGYSCLLLLGLPALGFAKKNHILFRMILFMMSTYIIWFFATQRNDRFLVTTLPVLAVLPCLGLVAVEQYGLRKLFHGVMLAIVGLQLWSQAAAVFRLDSAGYFFSPTLEEEFFSGNLPHFRSIEWLNRLAEENPQIPVGDVLFIGEAQSYGAKFNAIAPTVFNHHPLERGLNPTVTHILYNEFELDRLSRGYGPLGWRLGSFLKEWVNQNRDKTIHQVYDAYEENPGKLVVFEVIK